MAAPENREGIPIYRRNGSKLSVNRAIAFLVAGLMLLQAAVWLPASAEEIGGQAHEVGLYLWSESGEGKLHTWTTGDHGSDGTTVSIPSGSSLFFALHQPLRTDLPVDSYNAPERGFFIELYVNTAVFQSSHLNIKVRDGTSPTGGAILASGEMDVSGGIGNPSSDDQEDEELYWEDSLGPSYTFDSGHYIVVELENDGGSDVNLGLDTGTDGDTPSRLVVKTNPVRDITVLTEAFNLETSDDDDRQATDHFEPNLPAELARAFFSGTALNAFGAYDVASIRVQVDDPDGEELFDSELAPTDRGDGDGTVEFDDITWNYNDLDQPGAKQTGSGAYTVRVSAVDQQGHGYWVELQVEMGEYGVYLWTDERQQSVAVGGSVSYQLTVRNSGDSSDSFDLQPSDTSSNWTVEPQSWSSGNLAPGGTETVTFSVSVADSTEMVGRYATVSILATSQNSPSSQKQTFDLETKTVVGAEFMVGLYFEEGTQHAPSSEVDAVAGNWNDFELRVANLGQATDSVDLEWSSSLLDWDVEFEYDGERNLGITINGLPREEDGEHVANVTVWVRPAEGGDVDTSTIQLKGTSQGNATKTSTATLEVSRTFGLSLNVAGGGSMIYANLQPGGTQTVHLSLYSAIEGDHDVQLYVEDLPLGWSAQYKDGGETVTQVTISEGESMPLDLLVTAGNSATYQEGGYPVVAVAEDLHGSPPPRGRQDLTFNLALQDDLFQVTAAKYRAAIEPGGSYEFTLELHNPLNADDTYQLQAPSVPQGWQVSFPDGNLIAVGAGRSGEATVRITASDEVRHGDSEKILVTITSSVTSHRVEKTLTLEVEQGFGGRLTATLGDLWYVFVLLGLVMAVGAAMYYRSEEWDGEEWEDEEDDESASAPPLPAAESSGDDWDDWD
jgi:uncharacterized membrane protein